MTGSVPIGQDTVPQDSPERISTAMLEDHLAQVLSAWFGEHDLPPDDWTEFDPYVENMRLGLVQDGDLEPFLAGVRALLDRPELDLARLNAGQSDYDDGEMREILGHILGRLGRHAPAPTRGPTLLDWAESAEDWWVRRGVLHRIRPGDTLRSVAAEHRIPLPALLAQNPYYEARYRPDAKLPAAERVIRLGHDRDRE